MLKKVRIAADELHDWGANAKVIEAPASNSNAERLLLSALKASSKERVAQRVMPTSPRPDHLTRYESFGASTRTKVTPQRRPTEENKELSSNHQVKDAA